MPFSRLAAFQLAVHGSALGFLLLLYRSAAPIDPPYLAMAFWTAFGLLVHAVQFDAVRSKGQSFRVSVGFAASMASIVVFEPLMAAVVVSLGSVSLRDLTGKNQWHKILFNRSMFVLCAGLAGLARAGADGLFREQGGGALWGFAAAGLTYYAVNSLLVSTVVALASGRTVQGVWQSASTTMAHVSYLTLGIMGVSLATVFQALGGLVVALLGIPLVASYYGLRSAVKGRQFYAQTVQLMADSLDLREHETAGHTQRIAICSQRLGKQLGLGGKALENVYFGGLLHDLGKLGTPDNVLLKPSGLTPDEMERARRHPAEGARLIEGYENLSGVATIVRHHHERFDGSGYPDRMAGDTIPLGARIVAVVDAFDALYFGRPYRAAVGWEDIQCELKRSEGTHFDPGVVSTFLSIDWPKELPDLLSEIETDADR